MVLAPLEPTLAIAIPSPFVNAIFLPSADQLGESALAKLLPRSERRR